MIETIIVTRHPGLVDWLKRKGITGQVISRATKKDVLGKRVYGALPLRLAALADSVVTVDMPLLGEQATAGENLTADQMDCAGATLVEYRVKRVPYIHEPKSKKTNAEKLGRWSGEGFDLEEA